MIRFLQTPGRVQKAMLIGFLSIVCIMMVVTLVPGGMFSDGGGSVNAGSVAKVEGQDITIQQVQQIATNIMQQRHYPPQFKNAILPQAVESAVYQKVFLLEAKRLGLEATDDDLRSQMQRGQLGAVLYPDGKFIGAERYRDFVENQFKMSVPQFEQEVRNDLTMNKLRTLIGAGVFVSDSELRQAYTREKTKVKFDYAVISLTDLEKSVKVDDSELRAYYEKNQQQFANTIPEQRKVKYIIINPSGLPNPVKPGNEELMGYYRQHAAEYRVPESVKLRHILIKLPLPGPDGKVDQSGTDAAKSKAQDVLKQLKAGGDFAALAKKFSDDSATAAEGGSVGQLVQGSGSAPEIEKVAFGLNKGQTSELIQTSYGFEIIRVDDKTAARARSFDEMRNEIEPVVAAQDSQKAAAELTRKVENQAKASGLDSAAAANGLRALESDFISRNQGVFGIGISPQFSEAVFGMAQNAAPAAVTLDHLYAVAQVTAIKPPQTPGFEQVKDRITVQLKQQKAQAMLEQKTKELADKAHSGHNLAAAAKAVGATVKTSDLVDPRGQVPDMGQVSSVAPQLFDMKPGEISNAINLGQKGAVVALLERQEPTDAEFQAGKEEIREALLQSKRSEVEEVFVTALRERLEKEGRIVVDKKKVSELAGE